MFIDIKITVVDYDTHWFLTFVKYVTRICVCNDILNYLNFGTCETYDVVNFIQQIFILHFQ